MASSDMVHGIRLDDYSITTEVCSGCALGKIHRLPFKTGRERAKQIGEIVHIDVCQPMQQSSPNGSKYYVTFKDDFSGYRAIYFLKLKSDVFDRFKLFICKIKSETNHNVHTLRSDERRITQHRVCQLPHQKMYSSRDNRSTHPATKWRSRT